MREHVDDAATARLTCGEIELVGQIVGSSNETFLVRIVGGDQECHAVYKPELGERPLRDFPPGLFRRERAAYLLSRELGWDLVPPTIIREDGPLGIGSYQLFMAHDPEEHFFTLMLEAPAVHDVLRRLAVFDVIANNADRKSGHVLHGDDGRIWGIDNGLCFAAPLKLRTVIWDFAGERIGSGLIDDVAQLIDEVPAPVAELLDAEEERALRGRARFLVAAGELPEDPTGMRFPWPLI